MNQVSPSFKPVILVAPLNWGLGHATRCIPLINCLLTNHCKVILAGDGAIKALLKQEFPSLPFIDLPGYHITYSAHKWTMALQLALQIPKIISGIKYENQRLEQMVNEHHIDAIISDNRYGLYHKNIPGVFISHQLFIRTPFGNQADRYLQKLNYNYINRFTECWIPDHAHETNLSGLLSHSLSLPEIPVRYIGPLSRFHQDMPAEEKYLMFILSGPEPQRTIFENICLEQLKLYNGPVVFVRGLPAETKLPEVPSHICVYNHLNSSLLEEKMNGASFIVARCGYSTVMDLAIVKKKGILVPTPGQTEQEYLAKHLMSVQFAFCIAQEKFKLLPVLHLASQFKYRVKYFKPELFLDDAVKCLVARVKRESLIGK
jgi:uncharacterized protein (TIGR00661 family)